MFGLIIQDDEISTEAVQALDWLQWEIHVPLPVVTECQNQIREIKRLAGYRQGLLPTVPTALILESGEICHWSGRCTYLQQTARVSRLHDGTLVVTSKQIMFTSMSKPFTFSPSKIIKIGSSQDGIVLHTMSRTGAGEYQTHEPLALEAILTGLVHKHKYLLTDKPDPARSRHIPTRVQAEVRARDSDSCVKCGAREYLEFDHIIPHSKGGANTTGNIQILCRKCNGAKGNRV